MDLPSDQNFKVLKCFQEAHNCIVLAKSFMTIPILSNLDFRRKTLCQFAVFGMEQSGVGSQCTCCWLLVDNANY